VTAASADDFTDLQPSKTATDPFRNETEEQQCE